MNTQKYIYSFGDKNAEGNVSMKALIGGKGANLAEMNRIGVPVPPGFTITTEACNHYYSMSKEKLISIVEIELMDAIKQIESITDSSYGDPDNPCLLSVRSGARVSMPGMMDTVLNLGLNDEIVEGFAKKYNNERLAWDSYRRLIQMYGDVVMGLKPVSKEDEDPFEEIIKAMKKEVGVSLDTEMNAEHLKELVSRFKRAIKSTTGQDFPTDPMEQLWGAITSVFDSWMNNRAKTYRKLNNIPSDWGTAVNVQVMVFGNTGDQSATGVAFTRDPATGENVFMGEYLVNAQGEDVVAGIRTPQLITVAGSRKWANRAQISEEVRRTKYPSLEELMPEAFAELDHMRHILEDHYDEMQDLEFTIQEGKLWILQTRSGKRTGAAMVRIAMDMLREGRISEEEVLQRIEPLKLDELLHPIFDPDALEDAEMIAKGLPASPGAASGQIVFFADQAEEWVNLGKSVILVRQETSPEDIHGMDVSQGILTTQGGMTSHAAVVARGMGKCCVSGVESIHVDYKNRTIDVDGEILKEGDWISINGTNGFVYKGELPTSEATIGPDFSELLQIAKKYSELGVWANADTPKDARTARKFGAEGIGLCRTEHMFFEADRILLIRKMILAENEDERKEALAQLLPIQREDFEGLFEAMDGLPITIRLLDPPLHEFLPVEEGNQRALADELGISWEKVRDLVNELYEVNPMLGLRGCRVGNMYPEITEMQTRAILEAALNMKNKGIEVFPEIMVPLICTGREFEMQAKIIRSTAKELFEEVDDKVNFLVGTMIEIPRAAVVADRIAPFADFFSFGTNDLTQLTYGFSRDDIGEFLPFYLESNLLRADPFQTIDPYGVGKLVEIGTRLGRKSKPGLRVGVCGEHGGDPDSIEFFSKVGLNYVSCSPYRIPIARLAVAKFKIKSNANKLKSQVSKELNPA